MNKKRILVMGLSVIGILILVISWLFMNNHFVSMSTGKIQIILIDEDGTVLSDRYIEFVIGDKLEQLLKDNYDNVIIEDGMLLAIENFKTPSDWSFFISIYVDDTISMVGLKDIVFEDQTKISLVITKYEENYY